MDTEVASFLFFFFFPIIRITEADVPCDGIFLHCDHFPGKKGVVPILQPLGMPDVPFPGQDWDL